MLKINLSSPVPIYEQIFTGISGMIEEGQLKNGELLPSIRSLSKQLDIAINTVARAYMELERKGLIISNGRKGSFVSYNTSKSPDSSDRIFKEPLLNLIRKGYGKEDIIRIFNKNLSEIFD